MRRGATCADVVGRDLVERGVRVRRRIGAAVQHGLAPACVQPAARVLILGAKGTECSRYEYVLWR
jgi:hypothetical protein